MPVTQPKVAVMSVIPLSVTLTPGPVITWPVASSLTENIWPGLMERTRPSLHTPSSASTATRLPGDNEVDSKYRLETYRVAIN